MFSVVMHSPLCHRRMSQRWRGGDKIGGTNQQMAGGEVCCAPARRLDVRRGGVRTSPVGTCRYVSGVERWSTDFYGGQDDIRRGSPERWHLWVSRGKFYPGEVASMGLQKKILLRRGDIYGSPEVNSAPERWHLWVSEGNSPREKTHTHTATWRAVSPPER